LLQEREKESHKLYTRKKKKRKLQRSEIFLYAIKEKWTVTSTLLSVDTTHLQLTPRGFSVSSEKHKEERQ
jgi:hypothetical protein